jgi:hypothetical protein
VILNMIFMFFLIGWTINGGAFAAEKDMRWTLINAALACAAGFALVYRLS